MLRFKYNCKNFNSFLTCKLEHTK